MNFTWFAFSLLIIFFSFIYFERERARAGNRQRERGRERISSRLHGISTEPNVRGMTNHDIMTWAETKSRMLNWLSHSGVQVCCNVLYGVLDLLFSVYSVLFSLPLLHFLTLVGLIRSALFNFIFPQVLFPVSLWPMFIFFYYRQDLISDYNFLRNRKDFGLAFTSPSTFYWNYPEFEFLIVIDLFFFKLMPLLFY